jgi:hypothetical protein
MYEVNMSRTIKKRKGSKYRGVNVRYLPRSLSKKDKNKQLRMLRKSRKMYKMGKYYTRKKLGSFKSKKSAHVLRAMNKYGVKSISANNELSKASGCSILGLRKIIKKGEGAYYSSGSRPNQTAYSWGVARLASALTSGKSAIIDKEIINKYCNHDKKGYKSYLNAMKKYPKKWHARHYR